jgi:fructose-1-phosphate kinase PfkB-like protein
MRYWPELSQGLAKGQTNTETIRFGVACGAAAAILDGTNFRSKEMAEKLSEYVSITV